MGLLSDRIKKTELGNAEKDDDSIVATDGIETPAPSKAKASDEAFVEAVGKVHQEAADADALEQAKKVVSDAKADTNAEKAPESTQSATNDFMVGLNINPVASVKPVQPTSSTTSSANSPDAAYAAQQVDPVVKKAIDELDRINNLQSQEEKEKALLKWVDEFGELYVKGNYLITESATDFGFKDFLTQEINKRLLGISNEKSIQNQPQGFKVTTERSPEQAAQQNVSGRQTLSSMAHEAGSAMSNGVETIMDNVLAAGATLGGAAAGIVGGGIKSIAKNISRSGKKSAEASFAETAGHERALFADVLDSADAVKSHGAQFKSVLDTHGIEPNAMRENFLKSVSHLEPEVQNQVLKEFSDFSQSVVDLEVDIRKSNERALNVSGSLKENSSKEIAGRFEMLKGELSEVSQVIGDLPVSEELASIVKKATEQNPEEDLSIIDAIINEGPDASKDAIEKTKKSGDKINSMMDLLSKLIDALMALFSRDKKKEEKNEATADASPAPSSPMMP